MKKKILAILMICLIVFAPLVISGCSNHYISVEGKIISKFDRNEYNVFRSYWWGQPVYENHYYFIIQYRNNTYEREIDSKTYYSYEIRDDYTIYIKNEAI